MKLPTAIGGAVDASIPSKQDPSPSRKQRGPEVDRLKPMPSSGLNALARPKGRKPPEEARPTSPAQNSAELVAAKDDDGERGPLDGTGRAPLQPMRRLDGRGDDEDAHRDDSGGGKVPTGRRPPRRRKGTSGQSQGKLEGARALVGKSVDTGARTTGVSESVSQLTDILLLASRHGERLKSEGLSPLQIQLFAVREYLGLGTPEARRFLLSDVKNLLVERQGDTPAPAAAISQAGQNRNALLPLMLLNTLQLRSAAARERAQDKIDLVLDLNERNRR